MASLNRIVLIGNLGADPEMSYTPSGTAKVTFRLASHEVWNNKDGGKGERTEWHRVVAWGRLAEICGEYLTKGRSIYLEGRIQTRTWTDRDGQKHWMTEVIATSMQMLGSRPCTCGKCECVPAKGKADAPATTETEEEVFPEIDAE